MEQVSSDGTPLVELSMVEPVKNCPFLVSKCLSFVFNDSRCGKMDMDYKHMCVFRICVLLLLLMMMIMMLLLLLLCFPCGGGDVHTHTHTHTDTHRHRHTHREIERWDVMVAIVEPFQFMLDSSSEPSILEFQPSKQTNVRHRIQSKQSTNWSWHEMYLAVPVNTFDVVPSSL
jgi:hypothetical protein